MKNVRSSSSQQIFEGTETPSSSDTPSDDKLSKKLAAFTILIAAVCVGFGTCLMRTLSIMYVEVQEHYNVPASTASALSSFFFGCFYFFGPGAAIMLNCLGYTITIAFGTVLLIAGVISSAFVPSAEWLFLTFGVMPGIGITVIHHSVYTFIGRVCDRRRPLANNILIGASQLILMPLMLQYFIDNYGLPSSMIRVAFVVVICFPAGFVLTFILPKYYPDVVRQNVAEHRRKKMFNFELLKEKVFIFYILYCGFAIAVKISFGFYIMRLANSLGVDSIRMTYFFAVDGGMLLGLRLFTGWMYSRDAVCGVAVNRLAILVFVVALRFVAALMFAIFASSLTTLAVTYMFYTFTSGCIGALPVTVMTDLFGMERLSSTMGLKMFASGVFAVATSPLTTFLQDYLSSTCDPSFINRIPMFIGSVCSFICLLLLIPVWIYSSVSAPVEDNNDVEVPDNNQSENTAEKLLHETVINTCNL